MSMRCFDGFDFCDPTHERDNVQLTVMEFWMNISENSDFRGTVR